MRILKKKPGDTRNKRYRHGFRSGRGFPLMVSLFIGVSSWSLCIRSCSTPSLINWGTRPQVTSSQTVSFTNTSRRYKKTKKKAQLCTFSGPQRGHLLLSFHRHRQAFDMTEQEHDGLFKKVQNSEVNTRSKTTHRFFKPMPLVSRDNLQFITNPLQPPIYCLMATVKEAKGILGKDISGKWFRRQPVTPALMLVIWFNAVFNTVGRHQTKTGTWQEHKRRGAVPPWRKKLWA